MFIIIIRGICKQNTIQLLQGCVAAKFYKAGNEWFFNYHSFPNVAYFLIMIFYCILVNKVSISVRNDLKCLEIIVSIFTCTSKSVHS